MNKLTIDEAIAFFSQVHNDLMQNTWSRLGQSMFNVLYATHPQLANSVRGTNSDPFYNNRRINDFYQAVLSDEALDAVDIPLLKGKEE